jgi:glutathione S-transferase
MMQLYYAPDSIALAPHIVLIESGLDHALVKVDHHTHVNEDGSSYFEINPNGYVPSLRLEDGFVLTETMAIMQLTADGAPESGLCPPLGNLARYRVLAWTSFVATEIHQKFMRFTQADLTRAQYVAIVDLLKQRVSYAEAQLAHSRFLEGDKPTIADFFLYVATRWFKYHDVPLSQWPHLERCRAGIEALPSVRQAFAEEGLAGGT